MNCFRCGSTRAELHHVTLRDGAGVRLDPDLVVPLCHDCHWQDHDFLRALGLQYAEGGLAIVERVELRLRRVAVFGYRMSKGDPASFWYRLANAAAQWADELRAHTSRLDQTTPEWREVDGGD
jgi:hypothetical protein